MARPRTEKHQARLTVTLDESDYREVCSIAAQNDVSAAWVIRRAVHDFLGRADTPVIGQERESGRSESRR